MVRLSLKVHLPAAHEWYGWTVILASRERLELLQKSCNSSDRSLNRYKNAHKTRKECVLASACLVKSHRGAILTSQERMSELLQKSYYLSQKM